MEFLEKLSLAGLVPVIAIDDADDAVPLCKALADGGLPSLERSAPLGKHGDPPLFGGQDRKIAVMLSRIPYADDDAVYGFVLQGGLLSVIMCLKRSVDISTCHPERSPP